MKFSIRSNITRIFFKSSSAAIFNFNSIIEAIKITKITLDRNNKYFSILHKLLHFIDNSIFLTYVTPILFNLYETNHSQIIPQGQYIYF